MVLASHLRGMDCPIDLDRHDMGEHELDLQRSPPFGGDMYCAECNRYLYPEER